MNPRAINRVTPISIYLIAATVQTSDCFFFVSATQRRHLGGLGGRRPPPQEKEKKERKKEKREKKEKKKRKRKKGTMNDVKLLNIKCFFQFFNSPVTLKNKKFSAPPRKS